MDIDPQTLATYAGTLVGGLVGGCAFGWTWMRRVAAGAANSQALRELHVAEKKNEEAHRQFDERLRALEIETGRQQGSLEQINERLGEILGLLKGKS